MSIFADIIGAVRQVVTLDDRIARVEADVSKLQPAMAQLSDRLTRVETIIEMAMRSEPRRIDRD